MPGKGCSTRTCSPAPSSVTGSTPRGRARYDRAAGGGGPDPPDRVIATLAGAAKITRPAPRVATTAYSSLA
jgi:hypothetical protein